MDSPGSPDGEDWLPSAHGPARSDLRQLVMRGISWSLAEEWGRQLLSLVGFVVIARLVAPSDIGLVALAAVFVVFAQLLVGGGMGTALVQRRVLSRAHIDTVFWASLATGVALSVAGVVLAIPLGVLFDEPRLTPILQVLSLSLVLTSLTGVQVSLLRREMAQRSLAVRGLVAVSGGAIVGIVLAYGGFGAWALVAQQLTAALLSVLTLWRVSPWRPGRLLSLAHFRELFSFGANIVGGNIVAFLGRRADSVLVAIYVGTTQLGMYVVAYRVLDAAQAMLGGVAAGLVLSTFSRLQADRERLASAFMRVNRLTSSLVMPGFLGLALISPELIRVVFGPGWEGSGEVAAVLFLIGTVYSIALFGGAAFIAAGHPEVAFRLRLITTIVNVLGSLIAVAFFGSIVAVAVGYVLCGYLLLPLNLYWLQRYVGIPWRRLLLELRGVAAASLAMASAVLTTKLVMPGALDLAVILATEIAIGALVFLAALRLADRRLLSDIVGLVQWSLPGSRGTQHTSGPPKPPPEFVRAIVPIGKR
jgi:O-antigen/teichoic acid export membrane protein